MWVCETPENKGWSLAQPSLRARADHRTTAALRAASDLRCCRWWLPSAVDNEERPQPSCCGCNGQGEMWCVSVLLVAALERWSLREAKALRLRVHRPRGGGLPLRAGGYCFEGVAADGRPKQCCRGCTGHGDTGCLSVPVAGAREGWSLRGGHSPGCLCTGQAETGCLFVPVVNGYCWRGG